MKKKKWKMKNEERKEETKNKKWRKKIENEKRKERRMKKERIKTTN